MKKNEIKTEMAITEICEMIKKGITADHSGKMEGMSSYSTSCLFNPICQARSKDPNSICSKCYANSYLNIRTALNDKTVRNYKLMEAEIYPPEAFPRVNAAFFRLEAFGDLGNTNQAANYFNFAKRNPRTTFALWTKNPHIIADMMKATGMKKPSNLIIVYSSPKLNEIDDPGYDFIDKIFTVYSKDFSEANGIKINCGGNNCLNCGRCYSKRTARNVSEMLKSDQKKKH